MTIVTAFIVIPGPEDDGRDYALYTQRVTFVLQRALATCGLELRQVTRHLTGSVALDNRVFQTAIEAPPGVIAEGTEDKMRMRGFFGVTITRDFPSKLYLPMVFKRIYREMKKHLIENGPSRVLGTNGVCPGFL